MEAPETTKPDLVFDGELNFEKGVSLLILRAPMKTAMASWAPSLNIANYY